MNARERTKTDALVEILNEIDSDFEMSEVMPLHGASPERRKFQANGYTVMHDWLFTVGVDPSTKEYDDFTDQLRWIGNT